MSTVDNKQRLWRPISNETLNSKYEKCRNITEEIYKRINITFQIKNLATGSQSDISNQSDLIDSNDLSNETDLFAYDKTDSISSSISELDGKGNFSANKFVNVNNNVEALKKTVVPIYKKPKKRFRKRVKKRQTKANSDSEGSSDEAVPLSRIIDLDAEKRQDYEDSKSESPDNVMGVPKITIMTTYSGGESRCFVKETKSKQTPSETKMPSKNRIDTVDAKGSQKAQNANTKVQNANARVQNANAKEKSKEPASSVDNKNEVRKCHLCSMSFRAERGLRRHLAYSHLVSPEEVIKVTSEKTVTDNQQVRPA